MVQFRILEISQFRGEYATSRPVSTPPAYESRITSSYTRGRGPISVNSLAALRYGSGGGSERKGCVDVTESGAIRIESMALYSIDLSHIWEQTSPIARKAVPARSMQPKPLSGGNTSQSPGQA